MSLSMLSPEELAQLPGAQPPPGIIPNFVDPESCGNAVFAGLAISSALMALFVILRMYTKITIKRSHSWEDCRSFLGQFFRNPSNLPVVCRYFHRCNCKMIFHDRPRRSSLLTLVFFRLVRWLILVSCAMVRFHPAQRLSTLEEKLIFR